MMQGIVGSTLFKFSPSVLSALFKAGSPSISTTLVPCPGFPSFDPTGSFPPSLTLGGVRWKHSKRVNSKVQRNVPGGIRYTGFTYFPRFPDQKDPPYEPTKLFKVKRIRSLNGCPWWEKEWIEQFKLGFRGAVAIVKNTPINNARLYKLKHLVEIKPITTPYGLPDDPKHGFLKENGEFVAYNCIEGNQLQLEDAELEIEKLKKKSVDGDTMKHRLRMKWYSRW